MHIADTGHANHPDIAVPATRAARRATADAMTSRLVILDPDAVARTLGGMAAFFIIANLVAVFWTLAMGTTPHEVKLAYLFYLDGERNFPTAFSSMILFIAAVQLMVITLLEWQRGGHSQPYWMLLAAGFAFMGVDEAWSFHERLNEVVRARLGGEHLGAFYYGWVVPGLVLVGALGLLFLRFLWRLPVATRVWFIIAGVIYVGGVLGIELIEGLYDETHGDRNLVSELIATVQETLEMGGVIVFIHALLAYLGSQFGELRLRFSRERAPER
jgi:hypothetical protein